MFPVLESIEPYRWTGDVAPEPHPESMNLYAT